MKNNKSKQVKEKKVLTQQTLLRLSTYAVKFLVRRGVKTLVVITR